MLFASDFSQISFSGNLKNNRRKIDGAAMICRNMAKYKP